MEGSNNGTAKEAMSFLERNQAEFARYLMSKHFSGKDIYGEDIFDKTMVINGITIRASRFPPTRSYDDPVAYRKEVAEVEKKLIAEKMKTKEKSTPPLRRTRVRSARRQVVRDSSDSSSDSLQEISVEDWKEVQSAKKVAESGAGPSKSRR